MWMVHIHFCFWGVDCCSSVATGNGFVLWIQLQRLLDLIMNKRIELTEFFPLLCYVVLGSWYVQCLDPKVSVCNLESLKQISGPTPEVPHLKVWVGAREITVLTGSTLVLLLLPWELTFAVTELVMVSLCLRSPCMQLMCTCSYRQETCAKRHFPFFQSKLLEQPCEFYGSLIRAHKKLPFQNLQLLRLGYGSTCLQ